MKDTERPHHSNGVCLACGGRVDQNGMSEGGEVESGEHETEDMSGGPVGAESEEMAAQNAREFARAVNGVR